MMKNYLSKLKITQIPMKHKNNDNKYSNNKKLSNNKFNK